MTAPARLRIGSRGSPLALWQARRVRDLLLAAPGGGYGPDDIAIEVMRTTGDRVADRPLAELGGKGLFTKEIDAALLAGRIDLAVHSLKDVETALAPGMILAAYPERADPRDAVILRQDLGSAGFAALPQGAVVGSTSLRRRAQILNRRPDLRVVLFRGNVGTRLEKLAAGEADATLLALAGLERLGLEHVVAEVLPLERMLPAVGQGALAIACREADGAIRDLLAPLDDPAVAAAVGAERAMLAALDGSCHTPIAGHASIDADGALTLHGLVGDPDGAWLKRGHRSGPASDAEAIGADLGRELRAAAGEDFFSKLAD